MLKTRSFFSSFLALMIVTVGIAQSVVFVPKAYAADTISSALYLDTDDDGQVDTIRWTMDENVTACAYEAGDWTVDTASEMNISVTGLTCTGSDTILDIDVSADAWETGADTDPVISYADNGTTGSVTLTSGDMTAKAGVTIVDGAKPVVRTVSFGNVSGRNTVSLTYTEKLFSGLGYSTPTFGDITTAGTIEGFGSFATPGNTYTQTTKTFYNGNSLSLITFTLAMANGGYLAATSTTEPSGVFTPVASAEVADSQGNQVNTNYTPTAVNNGNWDLTKPTLTSATVVDSLGNNGKIDRVQLIFSEDMNDSSFEDDQGALGTSGTTTGSFNTTVNGDGDISDDKMSFLRTSDDNAVDTTIAAGDFTYALGSHYITDRAGNLLDGGTTYGLIDSDDVTEVDGASPIVTSVSPASGATGVDRTSDIVVTFSEAMDTTFDEGTEFTVAPDPGVFTEVWSDSDKTVTLSHTSNFLCGNNTVTTIEAEVVDAAAGNALNTSATEDGDWTFNVLGCSSSSSSGTSAAKTFEVDVTAPGDDDVFVPGENVEITWEAGGTGNVDFANLYFSPDAGSTHTLIESGAPNSGSYTWTVPEVDTEQGTIRVQLTDLAEIVAEDYVLGYFTIEYAPDQGTIDDEVTAPSTGDQGVSPVTGDLEDISVVEAGDYIKSPYFDTVYYIDASLVRHPFMDKQTYFTWQDSFDSIDVVTDATLMTLPLGAPMLPKSGVVLVKIQSSNRVYAVVDSGDMFSPTLRAINDEDTAASVYGSDWADYVIDIPVTLFPRFQFGDFIYGSDDISVDTSVMKKRDHLN